MAQRKAPGGERRRAAPGGERREHTARGGERWPAATNVVPTIFTCLRGAADNSYSLAVDTCWYLVGPVAVIDYFDRAHGILNTYFLMQRLYQRGARRHEADSARRWAVRGGTARGAGLREGDSARRRAATGRQRMAPSCESGIYLYI
eukprot:6202723-Pleurochrysis_carterae.AAC.2